MRNEIPQGKITTPKRTVSNPNAIDPSFGGKALLYTSLWRLCYYCFLLLTCYEYGILILHHTFHCISHWPMFTISKQGCDSPKFSFWNATFLSQNGLIYINYIPVTETTVVHCSNRYIDIQTKAKWFISTFPNQLDATRSYSRARLRRMYTATGMSLDLCSAWHANVRYTAWN